ncbi:ankyrin repeat-containing protein [Neptunitalea sp. Y10]|uniref:Ankyrin repeat-containing protein n=2 Tax=Neptunitalea lumnitzerae TaxID=2965509 RepID=A0ABQ5MMD2_9FLAO|nr:ankyrin repeat-containing protein [Neptunitalea sp. Y10]
MCSFHLISQEQPNNTKTPDVFDTARYGTLEQMESVYKVHPEQIDSLDERGFTPLILACYRGNTEVAKFLAEKTKQVDYTCDNGTALMAVCFKGNIDLAKALLAHGANPNMGDEKGTTPLIYAVQFQNHELVKLLLAAGADKTQKDHMGKSPFEYAVFTKNQEIIKLLKT